MTAEDIARAAAAFQDAINESYWEEHGITDDEAARGLLAAVRALGFATDADEKAILSEWKRIEREEAQRLAQAERERRAAMTAKARAEEDEMRASMRRNTDAMLSRLAPHVFGSNAMLKVLRSKNSDSSLY